MESAAVRLKRLRLRSMRRGIKEMDLILTAFSGPALAALPAAEVALYDTLLSENDHDILAWVTGRMPAPARYAGLVAKLRAVALDLPGVGARIESN